MSVISVEPAKEHATPTFSRSGTRWVCPYKVEVETAREGGDVIRDYFEATGRGINTPMRYADARDDLSFCDSITPVRVAKSRTQWSVVLTYTPLEEKKPESHEGPDGQPTEDPLDWRYEIRSYTTTVQVPVWKAWNIDPFPLGGGSGTYTRAAHTLGPVVNSAGIVLDPPLMANIPEGVLAVSGNIDSYETAWVQGWLGRINGSVMQFHNDFVAEYDVGQEAFEEWTVKVTGASASYRRYNQTNVWRYEYEFRFRDRASDTNPIDGWLETVLDRGLTRAAGAGDPDGFGSQFSAGDLETGMAEAEPIKGPLGGRVGELVLLDGLGQPLTGADAAEGVYFRWRVNPEDDLRGLALDTPPIFDVIGGRFI